MNAAEGDATTDVEENKKVDFADAFAIVCHRHGIYVPHDYEVDVATAPPGAFS